MRGRNNGPLFERLKTAGLILPAFILTVSSASQELLTLDKALEMVSRSSPAAELGALDEKIAEEKINESLSLYYPKVDLSLGHVHLDNDPAFKFGPVTFPAGEQLFWKWDFSVQQTLWDFGRRKDLKLASENSAAAVKARVAYDLGMKQAEAAAIYMEALTLRDQAGVVESRKASLAGHLKIAQNLYEQGVVTRNDLLRTEVALRSLDDQQRGLESAYEAALDRLKKIIGWEISSPLLLAEPVNSSDSLVPAIIWNEKELQAKALAGNNGLRALDEKINALEDAAGFARKDSYPYLVGGIGHSYEQNRYMAYPHVNKLFLGVSMNLFDGGAKKAKAAKAAFEVEKAKIERKDAERDIVAGILDAYRNYRDSLEEYNTAKLNVSSSAENFRIIEDQYNEGLLKTTDFLEAEALFAESRFSEVASLHRVIAWEARILALLSEDIPQFFSAKE